MRTWVGVLMVVAACGGEEGTPLPAFSDVEVVYVVGDSLSPSYGESFAALLAANDDERFPEFAGADLHSVLPGVEVVRTERGGDSYHAGIALPAGDDRQAMVVVELGVNDALALLVHLALDASAFEGDQLAVTMDALRQQVRATLAHFDDPTAFPKRPLIVVVDPVDPADDQGDLYDVALAFFPPLAIVNIDPVLLDQVLDELDAIVREEADAAGAVFVDARAHFVGHGYHAAEADRWVQNLLEVNVRGSHELRRAIWNAVTGAGLDGAIPAIDVPADNQPLPAVPDVGWANAVVDSDVTHDFYDPVTDRTYVNIGEDTALALGVPEASGDDGVALGLVGAFIVVDLGEGEEAFDGPGADLVVMEQGAMSAGAPEPYRVLVAASAGGPFVPVTDARGERAFDLASTGLASARYVRVESNAYIPDVMSGLGSPFYPGPEIYGIGAVYPGGAP